MREAGRSCDHAVPVARQPDGRFGLTLEVFRLLNSRVLTISMEELCILCNKSLSGLETVTVKKKGVDTIQKCSLKRDDGLYHNLDGLEVLVIHVSCRKSYINENMIKSYLKKKKLESQEQSSNFDFNVKCLFCNQDAEELTNKDPVRTIKMPQTRESITNYALQRGDSVSEMIMRRIENVDLVDVKAKYHRSCYDTFRFTTSSAEGFRKRGRPEYDSTIRAMDEIYSFIQNNNEECQFTINDLRSAVSDVCPDERTIIKKIKEKYGDQVIISSSVGKPTLFCFGNAGYKILHDAWYATRCSDAKEEKLRIVRTAASIILDEIRTTPYDTSQYPPPDQFVDTAKDDIPESLNTFLEQLIVKDKKDTATASRKCIAIAHAIITACRPRSFTSSVLLGIAALIDQKYAAKSLIQLLASLGFSLSYHEASLFKISAIAHNCHNTDESPNFCQYVFDNADHNVNTIDGHHKFHAMGGIKCHTPPVKKGDTKSIIRQTKIPPSFVVGNFGHVPLDYPVNAGKKGLKQIVVHNFSTDSDIQNISTSWTEMLWLFSKKQGFDNESSDLKNRLCSKYEFQTSEIIPLPFINNPPSHYETIYTSILLAVDNSKANSLNSTIITFDQPLYQKAKEITTSSEDPRLKSVVIRLGGFHTLMSYMGGIGYIMNGSGIKELWCTVYAPASADRMLTGHAYSRAVRANTLTHLSLAKQLLDKAKFDDEEVLLLEDKILNETDESTAEEMIPLLQKFDDTLEKMANNGPTAKLWVMYFKMVTLLKEFIEAERCGNWNLHLKTLKKMLPFFHAAGHFSYSKSATLYLQDMHNLQNVLTPEEHYKFTEQGCFTIRRNENFWCGTWSDMVIEQSLMRTMKSSGGLTHGRGLSDSVLAKWILAAPILSSVTASVEEFAGNKSFSSSEQHESSQLPNSRTRRDMRDLEKFDQWFNNHDPFPKLDKVMSLTSGITGDKDINCHKAQEIGLKMMAKSEGNNFCDLSYSRKDRVLPLATVSSSLKVDNTRIPVDPEMLFRRIAFSKKSQDELKQCLKYELAPFPLPLFDVNGMRKTKKSSFYDLFQPIEDQPAFENESYVIDGGYLLHKVVWPKSVTFTAVCDNYAKYLIKHFGRGCVVVFDGYPDAEDTSLKTAERQRRMNRQMCPDIVFNANTMVTVVQEKFLNNENNKKSFIELLMKKLQDCGIQVRQSVEDADHLIITTALDKVEYCHTVIIVGEDIDLLVILTGVEDRRKQSVFLMKPGKGKIEKRVYSSNSFIEKDLTSHVLFIHAFSGCDTTSAVFRQGKKKLVDVLKRNADLQNLSGNFKDSNANKETIIKAGERIMASLYTNSTSKTLSELRYELFARSVTKSKFNLACLPPTSGACEQHTLRTYCQVQSWLGTEKDPKDWGWTFAEKLIPVPTLDSPAPPEILSVVSCKCKNTCGKNCTCKKAALNCSAICADCSGKSCTGAVILEETDELEDDDITLESALTLFTNSGQPSDSDINLSESDDDRNETHDENKENETPNFEEPTTSKKRKQ